MPVVPVGSASSAAINLGTAVPPAWLVTLVGTGGRAWWTIAGLVTVGMVLAVVTWWLAREPASAAVVSGGLVQRQDQAQQQVQAQHQSVQVHVHAAGLPVVAGAGQVVVGEIPA